MIVMVMRLFDLFLKYENSILKLFFKSENIIRRKAIAGADGKTNKPILNILISSKKPYWKFEVLFLIIFNVFI